MNKLKLILSLLVLWGCSSNHNSNEYNLSIGQLDSELKYSVEVFTSLKTEELVAPRTAENGTIKMVKAKDWTSGFFADELWIMYELTGDKFWKEKAIEFTLPLEDEKWNGSTHDMGFKMFCSFGNAWHNTKDPKFREILIKSAKTLASRFNPKTGCIRSWDHNSDKWDFPVIIDNMMNLELLFWAAKETGNKSFKDIAVSHAERTMNNHFRSDNSSYHVVDYNPETGEVETKCTHQGYSNESSWSRGQGWGLYGFTMVYRETGEKKYLQHAEKIADYILNHPSLPDHKIPYWDFDAPNIPNEPFDASAGAVIASALFELSTFSEKGASYFTAADQILKTLVSPEFLGETTKNNGFLLKHSTGSKPHNSEVDVPLIYADYYMLEAIKRKSKLITY